jgi:hypothetical protein
MCRISDKSSAVEGGGLEMNAVVAAHSSIHPVLPRLTWLSVLCAALVPGLVCPAVYGVRRRFADQGRTTTPAIETLNLRSTGTAVRIGGKRGTATSWGWLWSGTVGAVAVLRCCVRHEASDYRGGWETSSLGRRSGPMEAGGSLTWGTPGRVASSPDNAGTCWYCQTVRVRLARPGCVTRVNQWLKPRNGCRLKPGG